MRLNGFFFLFSSIITVSALGTQAAEEALGTPTVEAGPGMDIRTTGYFLMDGGYISETEDMGLKKWRHEPFGSFTGGLRFTAQPSEKLSLTINPELRSRYMFPVVPGKTQGEKFQKARYDIYLEEAKAMWSFGDPAKPAANLAFGYLIHTDNPDTKVLGNYLFRSMIYPSLLFTKMDNTAAYLFGMRLGADFLNGNLKNNVFILSEVQHYPFFDVSLAYSGSYSLKNILEVGIGVNAHSLIPIRPSRTTPVGGKFQDGSGLEDNTYKVVYFQDSTIVRNAQGGVFKTVWVSPNGTDSATVRVMDSAGVESIQTVKATGNGIAGMSSGRFGNPALGNLTYHDGGAGNLYPELHGTNTSYSFAGTILGGRISFNPMGLFGEENPLGKEALKLYAELAVLGWKNYPGYYENRNERIPVMLGVNLPTFNHLDFLTLEVEQFKSNYIPFYERRSYLNLPQPGTHKDEVETKWDEDRLKKDDFKWVLSAKKSFQGWGLAAQAGTDHTKLADETEDAFFDVMSRPSQWYAEIRFIAGIR